MTSKPNGDDTSAEAPISPCFSIMEQSSRSGEWVERARVRTNPNDIAKALLKKRDSVAPCSDVAVIETPSDRPLRAGSQFAAEIEALAQQYVAKIGAAYQRSVADVIEIGRILIGAKHELPPGRFTAMIRRDLPFKERTAQRYMAIAGNQVLANPSHGTRLPLSYRTLSELASIKPEILEARIADGTINPDMERKHVNAILGKKRQQQSSAPTEPEPANAHKAEPGRDVAPITTPASSPETETHVEECADDREAARSVAALPITSPVVTPVENYTANIRALVAEAIRELTSAELTTLAEVLRSEAEIVEREAEHSRDEEQKSPEWKEFTADPTDEPTEEKITVLH